MGQETLSTCTPDAKKSKQGLKKAKAKSKTKGTYAQIMKTEMSNSESAAAGAPATECDDDGGSSSDCEDMHAYKKGGYHPVTSLEQFASGRYTALRKLGWGHFSTVWLALENKKDEEAGSRRAKESADAITDGASGGITTEGISAGADGSRRAVALKIQKSSAKYAEAARDEVRLLEQVNEAASRLNASPPVVCMLDHFTHRGENGVHHVLAFEVLGPSILSLIKDTEYKGLPLAIVKRIARCILEGLDFLHRELSIIHTDIKPENVRRASTRACIV